MSRCLWILTIFESTIIHSVSPHILPKFLFSNALKNKQSAQQDLKSIVYVTFLEGTNTSVLCKLAKRFTLVTATNDPTDLCWNLVLGCRSEVCGRRLSKIKLL